MFPETVYDNPLVTPLEEEDQRRRRESFYDLTLEQRRIIGLDTITSIGFAHIGHGQARCDGCGFVFNALDDNKDPVMYHGLAYPQCIYLRDYLTNGDNGDVLMAIQNQATKNMTKELTVTIVGKQPTDVLHDFHSSASRSHVSEFGGCRPKTNLTPRQLPTASNTVNEVNHCVQRTGVAERNVLKKNRILQPQETAVKHEHGVCRPKTNLTPIQLPTASDIANEEGNHPVHRTGVAGRKVLKKNKNLQPQKRLPDKVISRKTNAIPEVADGHGHRRQGNTRQLTTISETEDGFDPRQKETPKILPTIYELLDIQICESKKKASHINLTTGPRTVDARDRLKGIDYDDDMNNLVSYKDWSKDT